MADSRLENKLLMRLRELLQTVDLSTTTERQLRMSLEEEFDMDLSGFKRTIRQCVEEYLSANHPEAEEEAGGDSEDETPRSPAPRACKPKESKAKGKRPREPEEPEEKVPRGPLYVLSPEMASFVGTDKLQRTQVLKKVWEHIKERGCQDGRSITHDPQLAQLFEYPLDAGQLMKQLGRHLVEKIEGSALPSAKKLAKEAKAAAKAANPGRAGGYQKPLQLHSGAVWAYIKEHELQDPANKRNIICDDRLRALLGVDKFKGFGMMKYLNRHFITQD
eukprot:jgi/Tetstr1/440379/TSEL_028714.t1